MRPPPRSTLFPYTDALPISAVGRRRRVRGGHRPSRRITAMGRRVDRGHPTGAGERDRKSTRLNSSHVAISYAVFCLKKKKTARRDHEATSRNQWSRHVSTSP